MPRESGQKASSPPSTNGCERKNQDCSKRAKALLIGPGMVNGEAVNDLLQQIIPALPEKAMVLDAEALFCTRVDSEVLHCLEGRCILTPHAGEMAHILGISRDQVSAEPVKAAAEAANKLGAVVALKGAQTIVAAPDGAVFCNRAGNVGLATSGSGDTLSGIIVGLAARGASPLDAAIWGVYLHAAAGDELARRIGPLGFLARELLDEIPKLMAHLSA